MGRKPQTKNEYQGSQPPIPGGFSIEAARFTSPTHRWGEDTSTNYKQRRNQKCGMNQPINN
jgi:hypothetical protein